MQTETIQVNSCNTQISEELLSRLDIESRVEFFDILERIVLVQRLIHPARQRAKDRPKDNKGRIIVDLENLHILENMEYFVERANYFRRHGVYTHLYPNSNPNSEYRKFWDEERRRCLEGYVRESDGEWIPGYYYYYLNYCRIDIVKALEDVEELKKGKNLDELTGSIRSERIEDFPDIWDGDYMYFHYIEQAEAEGKHGAVLKTRGRGFSFKGAAMLSRNYFIIKKSRSFALASEQEYLTKDGLLTKTWINLNFIDNNTPWSQPREYKDVEIQKKASYRDILNNTEKGFMSEVIGITCKDNPNKARGKRGKVLLFEEGGKFPGLDTAWAIARKSVEQGRFVYGTMIAFGTGGTVGSDFESLEKFFYNPVGYGIKFFKNIFDKVSGSGVCAFFSPEYLNRQGCYDKDGNSDVIKALIETLLFRQIIRNNTNDPSALIKEKAEAPITPQEAVLRVEGSQFPVLDLKEYLAEISPNLQRFVAPHYVGKLTIDADGEIKFKLIKELVPIREFPLKDINKEGALEIFELPVETTDIYRYIIGCLTPGEKVMTDIGLMNVEEVTLNNKLINKDGQLVTIKNLQKYYTKNEDIYTFKLSNTFRTTTFTKEHPIYVSKNKTGFISYNKSKKLDISQRYHKFDFKFIKAEKVSVGDYIKVPNIYINENDFDYNSFWNNINIRIDRQIDNPLNNENFWWFVGIWLGDGWCENNGYNISIALNKNEIFYIDKLKRIINNTFNRQFSERIRNGTVEITFSFQQLNLFLNNTFGKYACGKFIPEWVKRLPINLKSKIILGYLDSDGSIAKNNYTEFVSINLELLEGIQDILFSLGIVSGINKLRSSGIHFFQRKKSNTKETYSLRIAQHNTIILKNVLDCNEDIKLKKVKLNKSLRRFPEGGCFFNEDKTYIYFQITEINKSSYTGDVYNFECDTHTFMCHHITTHNCDTYDDDEVVYSSSLGSCIVFDRYTRRIVAEYTGRPQTADAFYEIVYRMARFYNARIMYENNKKGLYGYFNNVKKAVWMLADTPEYLKEKQTFKINPISTNTSKGVNATVAVNAHGRRMQASWLLEEFTEVLDELDERGEPKTITKLRLQQLRSIGYIKECIAWNPDINADRVSAMNMVMIFDAELKQFEDVEGKKESNNRFASDPFLQKFLKGNNKGIQKYFSYTNS